jgi:hypothetical protein
MQIHAHNVRQLLEPSSVPPAKIKTNLFTEMHAMMPCTVLEQLLLIQA